MNKPIHRRSVTITDSNNAFICKVRGEAICNLFDLDYTTVLNKIIVFAIENGFTSKDLMVDELQSQTGVNH